MAAEVAAVVVKEAGMEMEKGGGRRESVSRGGSGDIKAATSSSTDTTRVRQAGCGGAHKQTMARGEMGETSRAAGQGEPAMIDGRGMEIGGGGGGGEDRRVEGTGRGRVKRQRGREKAREERERESESEKAEDAHRPGGRTCASGRVLSPISWQDMESHPGLSRPTTPGAPSTQLFYVPPNCPSLPPTAKCYLFCRFAPPPPPICPRSAPSTSGPRRIRDMLISLSPDVCVPSPLPRRPLHGSQTCYGCSVERSDGLPSSHRLHA